MAKTIFEQMGGTYTQVGDYLLPDLKLPEEETQANIGELQILLFRPEKHFTIFLFTHTTSLLTRIFFQVVVPDSVVKYRR